MQEIWKDIVAKIDNVEYNYIGHYQISSYGRVRSLKRGTHKIIKLNRSKSGYVTIGLSKNGQVTRFYVHRLVALMFLPNPNNFEQVNHKDEDKGNNNVTNLEWCSTKYNNGYGTRGERISKKLEGYTHSEKTKALWSTQRRGEGNSMYGKKHTEESKRKMSATRQNKGWSEKQRDARANRDVSSQNNPNAKKIVCLETKQVFNTIKDASLWCNVSDTSIIAYLKGRSKSAGKHPQTGVKLHWAYLN